jgi:hypothetical protein
MITWCKCVTHNVSVNDRMKCQSGFLDILALPFVASASSFTPCGEALCDYGWHHGISIDRTVVSGLLSPFMLEIYHYIITDDRGAVSACKGSTVEFWNLQNSHRTLIFTLFIV